MAYISKIKIPGDSNTYDVKDANAEVSSNKVTSWSSTTTDAHYPSEKLVKASLDGKIDKTGVVTTDGTHTSVNSYVQNGVVYIVLPTEIKGAVYN